MQRLHDVWESAFSAPSATCAGNSIEAFDAIRRAEGVVPRDERVYRRSAVSEDQRVPYFGRTGVFDPRTAPPAASTPGPFA